MGGRMFVMLNGEPLEEVDCFKSWKRKWQLMEDVKWMWYTMSEWYSAWGGAQKSMLSNRGLGMKAKRSIYMKE